MKHLIIPTLDAVVTLLRSHAAQLGVDPQSIQRTYSPDADAEELAENHTQNPLVLVFLQDADENEEAKMVAGVTKTISCAVGLMQYAPKKSNDVLDPHVTAFETLQNIFAEVEEWEGPDGLGFVKNDYETVDIVSEIYLKKKIAMSRIDLEIDATAAVELE